jgi:LPS sulfotransferase NodH
MLVQSPPNGTSPIADWLAASPQPADVAQRGYIICATPRSGSYFLCDLLRSTGVLGRPHEYFEPAAMRRHGAPDYPDDLARQIAMARTFGCTANGVFGTKLFPSQIDARALQTIMAGFGNPVLIFLEREDLLGQAISQTRAAQAHWFTASPAPRFDAALIRDHLELLVRWNAEWRLCFTRRGIVPLRVSYEQVMADPDDAVAQIARALGLEPPPPIDPARLSMKVQRDALSAEWRERFLALQTQRLELHALRSLRRITWQRRLRRLARSLHIHAD